MSLFITQFVSSACIPWFQPSHFKLMWCPWTALQWCDLCLEVTQQSSTTEKAWKLCDFTSVNLFHLRASNMSVTENVSLAAKRSCTRRTHHPPHRCYSLRRRLLSMLFLSSGWNMPQTTRSTLCRGTADIVLDTTFPSFLLLMFLPNLNLYASSCSL